ncbi:transferase family-domain-containing protein [Annulohypoxylon nitens]|nr:transferase family-domain-containing protein [Annulohypoxylon nitens]
MGSGKETFHLDPSNCDKSQEEWFRLSVLDLYNTQNYSTHALIFKLQDSAKAHIIETFKRGIEATLGQCRHLVGTIRENEYGDYSIVREPESTVRFDVQWLDDYPSYTSLEKANFTGRSLGNPARLTIEGMTMACKRLPDTSPPMVAFQLNLIPGGLIFTVHQHHAALDMDGTVSLVHQIANHCYSIVKGTAPPSWNEELMDRSRFFSNVPYEKKIDPPPMPGKSQDWFPCSWLLFHLPQSKAAELKQLCAPDRSQGAWISTYDALVAFLWRVVSKHRAQIYKQDLTQTALFFEPVNMRSRLTPEVSKRYQGNCLGVGSSYNRPDPLTLADVISKAPLSRIAVYIRQMTQDATQEALDKTVEMLGSYRRQWALHPPLAALPPTSFVVTDWRSADMCDVDFGFGRPVAFRQLSDVVEHMMVIYPPMGSNGNADRGVEVMLPFETHAIDMLMEDVDMKRFFEFQGVESS